ncbi:PTS sugar transporter subunit IIB [Georgenia faecalis]|uniref:PTS sugar transporter subunit IIB n=1 Tax=Georgenia faecalis TaxID=2483799 RepID=A0ABV9DAL2_9MICO|nr:PTS sugar transporter subunit IIB [Georgenia faecalis]
MKIVAVCGMGIGTSVILKMNIEKVLERFDVDAQVEAADISTARGAAQTADLVLTSAELAPQLGEVPADVVVVDNFVDEQEIEDKLVDALDL